VAGFWQKDAFEATREGGGKMRGLWKKMLDRRGQSLVEYALMLAIVAIVVITALTVLGGNTSNAMVSVANEFP
jgi:Flp pilus assembly pilin Flp